MAGARSDGSCLRSRRKVALPGYADLAIGMDSVAHDGLLIANRYLVHR